MIISLSSIVQIAHSVGLTLSTVLATVFLANDSAISTVAGVAMEIAELLAGRNIDGRMMPFSSFRACETLKRLHRQVVANVELQHLPKSSYYDVYLNALNSELFVTSQGRYSQIHRRRPIPPIAPM